MTKPLTVGSKVIIKLGPNHRQYSRLEDFAKGKFIVGTVDWMHAVHGRKVMEVRISRSNTVWQPGQKRATSGADSDCENFYIRVEYVALDCYNFRDVLVIRKVSYK